MADEINVFDAINGVIKMDHTFGVLNSLDVNGHTEKKKSGQTMLTYLSWAWAWAEVKKRYPNANYVIERFDNSLPYVYDPLTGYMVFTKVTIEGITHEMWLPCMDANNRAMKSEPYQITFANGKTITVPAATMFDINKTIMRCLVKNLAMFGLGLYIYAGEDLPESTEDVPEEPQKPAPRKASKPAERKQEARKEPEKATIPNAVQLVIEYTKRHQMSDESVGRICKHYKCDGIENLSEAAAVDYIELLEKRGGNINE